MFNIFAIHAGLRANGVIGINERNLDYVFRQNKRRLYELVDDKIVTKQLAAEAGVQVAETYAVLEFPADFAKLKAISREHREFVIKPSRGSGGGGILVIGGVSQTGLRKASGHLLSWEDVRFHLNNLLSGMYSLGGGSDRVIVEQRLRTHPILEDVSFRGVPDLRIIVYRGVPVMAMLRLPTSMSDGKANLHMGGVGVGVDIATGVTTKAVCLGATIEDHPDFELPVTKIEIPFWSDALENAARLGSALGLGYVGVDLVIDASMGPTMLEVNARPGISIQVANGEGMRPRLHYVDALETIPDDPTERCRLAMAAFRAGEKPGPAASG